MSLDFRDFQGVNEGYLLELYDRYVADPQSVDERTRELFQTWTPSGASPIAGSPFPRAPLPAGLDIRIAVGAISLAESIRRYGHLAARIDPLGSRPRGNPLLQPEGHGITNEQLKLMPATLINEAIAEGCETMYDLVEKLRKIYCGTTGYDIAHIFVPEERLWLRDAIETGKYRAPKDPIDPVGLLERLTDVEVFEKFLHRTYPGKTRFSIEGVDMLVPILDEVLAEAAEAGLRQAFIGMAHRGRLNVMAHVMGKPYKQILAEFKDPVRNYLELEGVQWAGDVKYHLGASRAIRGGERVNLLVSMPPNPSHLESINPVLEGMARAAGTDASKPGAPTFNPDAVLPILVHGDAAFPGQGVVAETLNLHGLRGYTTGGTIHIIANNQIGFTTEPSETYSTLYASGLARGFKIPIFHVNADDPEACVEAARLALGYRMKFRRDVLIDLVGYRRYGHNEGDEPGFTQPTLYAAIAQHPTVRERWARTLEERGLIEPGRAQVMVNERMERLQRVYESVDLERDFIEPTPEVAAPGTAARTRTSVPIERLRALNEALLSVPEGFTVHRKLERSRERRRQAFDNIDEPSIDWATAEALAYASILEDGTPIRLTGEDVARGTFSHRHAVLRDAQTGEPFVPLQALPQARAAFEIHNSPLTELATVGFEYGYDIQAPDRLVIWEAQYGDFINGAQLMLDEFVLSARAKWGQEPALVLLLPHGHEGQGPDHASARPERFLQLAADTNMRVANCTTAAQFFHLLRRQAALLVKDPLPLVVLTPKSLLRHPFTASTPRELAEGGWREIIEDVEALDRRDGIRRLIFCSGKIAVDLFTSPYRETTRAVAITRVEQLFPLPVDEMLAAIESFPNLEEVFWVQEEPENMGAWDFVRPQLEALVGRRRLAVLARPRSSSPAEGSAARHAQNQERLIARAFELPVTTPGRRTAARK
ncbi:MAG: 2-oxoglutarate dehydrogenase E1 component [Acidobacteriota bacterium]|jgi:2-oxoglutarate dehydrogenase E1 component|nr:MAG: 2-oxoglutarate dehydrogenase E1 component [Acidobacteriota bacterium]